MRRSLAIQLSIALVSALLIAVAALAAGSKGVAQDKARFLSAYTWSGTTTGSAPGWFGGFSGIEISDDGAQLLLLSDRATLVSARLSRTEGRITAAQLQRHRKLRTSTGKLMQGRVMDSEGLALAPDGTVYISYEGVPRITRHRRGGPRADVLPRPGAFDRMPFNKALEALAIDAAGNLYTLPENAPDKAGNLPVWRWDGSRWSQPFSLPQRGGFLPVGADFGPDGRFYLLEREFLLVGFRSRLRRWDITPAGPAREITLLQTGLGQRDNLEGVSIWRDAAGSLRATMISCADSSLTSTSPDNRADRLQSRTTPFSVIQTP